MAGNASDADARPLAIEARGLIKRFDGFTAVDGVDLTVRAGETVVLRASSHRPGPAEVAVDRISCGDPTRWGPGWSVDPVPVAGLAPTVELVHQPLVPGSYGTVDLGGLTASSVGVAAAANAAASAGGRLSGRSVFRRLSSGASSAVRSVRAK